jgi:hypothetical protein
MTPNAPARPSISPSPKQLAAIKTVLFVLALLPFARIVWLIVQQVPVEPVEFVTHGTGDWACTCCAPPSPSRRCAA